MGKTRSGPLRLAMKLTHLYKRKQLLALKPPYPCPWCWEDTCETRKKGVFIFVFCARCRQGELMPLHRNYKPIDYYCILFDSIHNEEFEQPVFKFRRLKKSQLERLQKYTTIGEIEVMEVYD